MLLTFVHSLQGGETTELEVAGWFDVLGRYEYADAKAAVRAHVDQSQQRITAAHVLHQIKTARRAVTGSTMSPRRIDCAREGRAHAWIGDTCRLCEVRRWELEGTA